VVVVVVVVAVALTSLSSVLCICQGVSSNRSAEPVWSRSC